MKTNIAIFTVIVFAAFAPGCNWQDTTANNSHAGMDHTNQPMDHANKDHSAMRSSPNAAAAPYDLQFLDTMIAHHQGAVEMAGPATTNARHAEIVALAINIISSQKQEIDQMKAWREQWFAGNAPAVNMEMPGMNDSMMGMDMKALDTLTGNAFDLEFIKQMIPHHEGAVVMAKEALQRSSKEEIKTLANAIVKAQEAEIGQMKAWQTAWAR